MQTVVEIWRFKGFQNGGRQPSWIFQIQFFNGLGGLRFRMADPVSECSLSGRGQGHVSNFYIIVKNLTV